MDALALARRLWASPAFRRVALGFLAVVVAFLWYHAVRRGLAGRSSQLDDFVRFGRNLFLERINVYEVYEPDYTITKYPPFFGLLFVPLALLPMGLAATAWFWLNLALSLAAARIAAIVAAGGEIERPSRVWIPYVLTAPVIISNLETSQVNIVITALLYWALLLYLRGRDGGGGFVLGMATALKLTSGIFIPYFLWKREWRVVAGAALGLLAGWLVVPVALLGWEGYVDVHLAWLEKLLPFLAEGTRAEGLGGFRHTNQSLSAFLHRTLARIPAEAGREDFYVNVVSLPTEAVVTLGRVLNLAMVAGLAWLCRARNRDRRSPGLGFEYALLMIAALFMSPISWINHYVVLLLPYAVAVRYVATRPDGLPERELMLRATALSFALLLTAASVLLQAFSLPFLGAVVLAAGIAVVLQRERARREPGSHDAPSTRHSP